MMRNQKGITLVALVITIIVLLILAAVSISMVLGPNGILNQANQAKESTNKGDIEEQLTLAITTQISQFTADGGDLTGVNIANNVKDAINTTDSEFRKALPGSYTVEGEATVEATTNNVKFKVKVDDKSYSATYDVVGQAVTVENAD